MRPRTLRTLAPVSLSLAYAACAPALPPAPTIPDASAFTVAGSISAPGLPEDTPGPFTLAPGDEVELKTISVRPMEHRGVLDAQGALHVPMAGSVGLKGLTLGEAESRIEAALRPFDRFAQVALRVTEARGHLATVAGAVAEPGRYPLEGRVRISDLLALAGGVVAETDGAERRSLGDLGAAQLLREGEALPIDVGLAQRGTPGHDVFLREGDLLFVPAREGQRISVFGEVREPKVIGFDAGMRLTEALTRAGGLTDDADRADIRVLRGPLSAPMVYRARLDQLLSGEAPDVVLAPGDVIYVTTEWLAEVGEVIRRLAPGLGAAAVVGLTR